MASGAFCDGQGGRISQAPLATHDCCSGGIPLLPLPAANESLTPVADRKQRENNYRSLCKSIHREADLHAAWLNGDLVVGDAQCPQIRQLLAESLVPVLWLDPRVCDPFDQINAALEQRRHEGNPVQILHWVSHGSPGVLRLGDINITTKVLLKKRDTIANWRLKRLALWSCSTGSDPCFSNVLEKLSGADVFSADHPLGRPPGGEIASWQLFSRRGLKPPSLPVQDHALKSWSHQLLSFPVKAGGTNDDLGQAITSLEDGSSLVAGRFQGSVTFGTTSLTSAGAQDVFIAKLNPDGTYAWATQAGGAGDEQVRDITSFDDGSSIVTGNFSGTATFGSTTLTSAGQGDVFIAKLNADGSYAWAVQGGGSKFDIGYGVEGLSDGSSLVTGYFEKAATFGGTSLTATGSTNNKDIFIAKLNSDGTFSWVTQAGGTQEDISYGLAKLNDGSSLITGFFTGAADFGSTTLNSNGKKDVFIAKLNSDGSYAWATQAGASAGDYGYEITSLSDGSAIVTGFFTGRVSFGTTNLTAIDRDVFIAKLNPDGSYAWAKKGGGLFRDYGHSITSLSDGSSLVTGFFKGRASFGSTTLTSAGNEDVFIAKLNPDGSYAWVTKAGGTGNDTAFGITGLSNGSSLITGRFQSDAAFGAATLTSAGGYDSFIAALDKNGNWLSGVDPVHPLFQSAATSIDGNTIVLVYNEALSATTAVPNDFVVTNNGVSNQVTAVIVSGSTVELTLATSIKNDEVVSLTYTDPTGGDDVNAIQDAAGNDAVSLLSVSVTNNSTVPGSAPFITSTYVSANGATIGLVYNEALSATTAVPNDFVVKSNGISNQVTAVIVSGSTVELTLARSIKNDDSASVTYTDPTIADDIKAIQDTAGNDVKSFVNHAVKNSSKVPGSAPFLSSTYVSSNGTTIGLVFNESLSTITAVPGDFIVKNNGASNQVTAVAVSDATVELTLARSVQNDEIVSVIYTDPTVNDDIYAIQDSVGNDATSQVSAAVTNNSTVPGSAPLIISTYVSLNGTTIGLIFNEALSTTTASAKDFFVKTNGSSNQVTAVAVNGTTVELTLANSVKEDEIVFLTYIDPTVSDDINAIQDLAGNDAVSQVSAAITNNSTYNDFNISPGLSQDSVATTFDLIPNTLSASTLEDLDRSGISLASKVIRIQKKSPDVSDYGIDIQFPLADIAPGLDWRDDIGKRSKTKKFLYYSIGAQGNVSSLAFDPVTQVGARFYDIDGNGFGDFISLKSSEDRDGVSFQDESILTNFDSTAATVELSPAFSLRDNGLIELSDPSDNLTPAVLNLEASIISNDDSIHSVGCVVLDADEAELAEDILSDIDQVSKRSVNLLSSLESKGVTLNQSFDFSRSLQIINGQSLRFFSTLGSSLSDLHGLADPRFAWLDQASLTDGGLIISSGDDISLSISQLDSDPGIDSLIAQKQASSLVLDCSGFAGYNTISGNVSVAREASLDSLTGFYHCIDAQGSVLAEDGLIVAPGQVGYAAAALRETNRIKALDEFIVDNHQAKDIAFSFNGSGYLAPYSKVNNMQNNEVDTFFAFAAANSDGLEHFKSLGDNLFCFEDTLGGGDLDYDDLIIGLRFDPLELA